MKEIWKPIIGYEGLYEVSSLGNIKRIVGTRCKKEHIITPRPASNGYLRVNLSKGNKVKDFSIHRLVATAFIENVSGKAEVNHIDGDKTNNCIDNLEWVTKSENERHKVYSLGKSSVNKPSKIVCLETGEVFESITDAANSVGVNECRVRYATRYPKTHIVCGYHWSRLQTTRKNMEEKENEKDK